MNTATQISKRVPAGHRPETARRQLRVVIVVPRGEAVRNFIYSDTLRLLSRRAKVVLLSVVTNEAILAKARPYVEEIVIIEEQPVHPAAAYLRTLVEHAHDRWLWSQVAQNNWELRARRARQAGGLQHLQWLGVAAASRLLANPLCLRALTACEQSLQWRLRSSRFYDHFFARCHPDLVFNASHIHGPAGELPLRVAHRLGLPTAGFIFSWDNLTSRSRILVPYRYWLVWHEPMKQQLLHLYPKIRPDHVFVTGTPQMDFLFQPQWLLSRPELCRRIGLDPARPFILYTTGVDRHFPREHLHVASVINLLGQLRLPQKPQLVVRIYIKGISPQMQALAERRLPDVVFPPMLWDLAWATPRPEDLELYCSLVHHAALSINAASTVSLEFILKDKPVINLDYDPPGSRLAPCDGFKRHIRFDHFWPVARSGATMVATSEADLRKMLIRGLTQPAADHPARQQFVADFFGFTADGQSSLRTAETLLRLAANH